jgi:hypothetical protein
MATREHTSSITDPLRQAIIDRGSPWLQISRVAGLTRTSLMRFVRGPMSLPLDVAAKLAVHFGLKLVLENFSTPKAS